MEEELLVERPKTNVGPEIIHVWDVDGVAYDSAHECWKNTVESFSKHEEALRQKGLPTPHDIGYKEFMRIRPYVAHARDYFTLPLLVRSFGEEILKNPARMREEIRRLQEQHAELIESLTKGFYEAREKARENKTEWLASNKAFPGIKEVMDFLKSKGIRQAVVSSKDRRSVKDIMSHHGLLEHIGEGDLLTMEDSVDPSKGKPSKAYSFRLLKKKYPNARFVFIDDIPSALLEVFREHPDVALMSALWGYGLPEEHEKVPGALQIENPQHLLEKLREIFSSGE